MQKLFHSSLTFAVVCMKYVFYYSCTWYMYLTTPCLKKNCAKLFLSELRQISTNFDNFWQKDGKEAKVMRGALSFHLT